MALILAPSEGQAQPVEFAGIVGKDDRVPMDSAKFPWSAIGRVNLEIGGYCTGTVIAPGKVLTAAHCLWNPRTRNWYPAQFIHFVAGYRRGKFIVHARVKSYAVNKEYLPENPLAKKHVPNSQHDWALLYLSKDVAPITGVLPVSAVGRKSVKDIKAFTQTLTQAGYSGDRAHLLTIHKGCGVTSVSNSRDILYHNCDTVPGDSGSPIFRVTKGQHRLVGMHVSTITYRKRNHGIAVMGQSILDWLAGLK